MKRLCRLVLGLYLLSVTMPVWAVTIEGNTPSGKFKTVFVTEAGRLPVEITTTTLQHVVVDSGTITSYQGGVWSVSIAGVGAGGLTVSASTVATIVANSLVISSTTGPAICYPADPHRVQGVLCNNDTLLDITMGPAGFELMPLAAGACYSPDGPSSFVGQISCASSGTVTVSYIYQKTP